MLHACEIDRLRERWHESVRIEEKKSVRDRERMRGRKRESEGEGEGETKEKKERKSKKESEPVRKNVQMVSACVTSERRLRFSLISFKKKKSIILVDLYHSLIVERL